MDERFAIGNHGVIKRKGFWGCQYRLRLTSNQRASRPPSCAPRCAAPLLHWAHSSRRSRPRSTLSTGFQDWQDLQGKERSVFRFKRNGLVSFSPRLEEPWQLPHRLPFRECEPQRGSVHRSTFLLGRNRLAVRPSSNRWACRLRRICPLQIQARHFTVSHDCRLLS